MSVLILPALRAIQNGHVMFLVSVPAAKLNWPDRQVSPLRELGGDKPGHERLVDDGTRVGAHASWYSASGPGDPFVTIFPSRAR